MGRGTLLLMLVGANLLWGSSWVVSKLALEGLTPLQINGWRMVLAGVLALPWLLPQLRRASLPPGSWVTLLVLGFMGFVGSKYLNLWGLERTSATNASLLMSVEPLFTIVLGVLLLGEALTRRRVGAFVLGAAGGWLIIAPWSEGGFALGGAALGDLIFLSGLLLEAGYSVVGKSLLTRYPPGLITLATVVMSMVFWAPALAMDVATTGFAHLGGMAVPVLLYLSIGCTLLAYWAWFRALQGMDAGLAALTIFVQPVWGALLSMLILGETMGWHTLAGGTLVLGALWLAVMPEKGRGAAGGEQASARK